MPPPPTRGPHLRLSELSELVDEVLLALEPLAASAEPGVTAAVALEARAAVLQLLPPLAHAADAAHAQVRAVAPAPSVDATPTPSGQMLERLLRAEWPLPLVGAVLAVMDEMGISAEHTPRLRSRVHSALATWRADDGALSPQLLELAKWILAFADRDSRCASEAVGASSEETRTAYESVNWDCCELDHLEVVERPLSRMSGDSEDDQAQLDGATVDAGAAVRDDEVAAAIVWRGSWLGLLFHVASLAGPRVLPEVLWLAESALRLSWSLRKAIVNETSELSGWLRSAGACRAPSSITHPFYHALSSPSSTLAVCALGAVGEQRGGGAAWWSLVHELAAAPSRQASRAAAARPSASYWAEMRTTLSALAALPALEPRCDLLLALALHPAAARPDTADAPPTSVSSAVGAEETPEGGAPAKNETLDADEGADATEAAEVYRAEGADASAWCEAVRSSEADAASPCGFLLLLMLFESVPSAREAILSAAFQELSLAETGSPLQRAQAPLWCHLLHAISLHHLMSLHSHAPRLIEWTECLSELPFALAEMVLRALLPLMPLHAGFRDHVMLMLRKLLGSAAAPARQLALRGLGELLRRGVLADEASNVDALLALRSVSAAGGGATRPSVRRAAGRGRLASAAPPRNALVTARHATRAGGAGCRAAAARERRRLFGRSASRGVVGRAHITRPHPTSQLCHLVCTPESRALPGCGSLHLHLAPCARRERGVHC